MIFLLTNAFALLIALKPLSLTGTMAKNYENDPICKVQMGSVMLIYFSFLLYSSLLWYNIEFTTHNLHKHLICFIVAQVMFN